MCHEWRLQVRIATWVIRIKRRVLHGICADNWKPTTTSCCIRPRTTKRPNKNEWAHKFNKIIAKLLLIQILNYRLKFQLVLELIIIYVIHVLPPRTVRIASIFSHCLHSHASVRAHYGWPTFCRFSTYSAPPRRNRAKPFLRYHFIILLLWCCCSIMHPFECEDVIGEARCAQKVGLEIDS